MKGRSISFGLALIVALSVGAAGVAEASPANTYTSRMAAHGLNNGNSVVQIGAMLYAGPNCPGGGFTCVNPNGKSIVQVVRGGSPGAAIAACSGCVILQFVEDGQPAAPLTSSCTQGTADNPVEANPLSQSCTIEQDNAGGGNNTATVQQYGTQRVTRTTSTNKPHNVSQSLTQDASITQVAAGTGANDADVRQWLEQKITTNNTSGVVTHNQESTQKTVVHQDSDDGDQVVTIDQDLIEKSNAMTNSGAIVQKQNATDDGRDVFAEVRQFADMGYNTANLTQDEELKQWGSTAPSAQVTQRQGAPSGGLTGDFEGDQNALPTATKSSKYTAKQNKDFRQDVYSGTVAAQVQDDIIECCDLPFGFSKSYHDCSITGDSLLKQAPGGEQIIKIRLLGQVDRNCTAAYTAQTQDAFKSDSQSGPRVAIGTNCTQTSCQSNRAPEAANVTASGAEDTAIGWTPSVSDPDGNALTCGIDEGPSHGTASVATGCGSGTYTPAPNFNGTDSFTYYAEDVHGFRSISGTVTVTVTPVADAPVANEDSATTDEDVSVTIDVAANDTDVDGDLNPASVTVISGPSNGAAVANGNGTVTYTPAPDYNGSDSFRYRISDATGLSATANVAITVIPVDDPARSGLVLRVKNATQTTYSTSATVSPTAPSADYRVTYTNSGEANATNVVVRHPLPSGGSLTSCSNSCTVSGGQIVWTLGSRAPGSIDLDARVTFSFASFGPVTTKATGTATGEAPYESNEVTVQKQCVGPFCI